MSSGAVGPNEVAPSEETMAQAHRAMSRRELLRDVGIGIVVLGAGGIAGYEWPHTAAPKAAAKPRPFVPRDESVFHSRPDLVPPRCQMTVPLSDLSPGYILLSPSLIPSARALTRNSGLSLGVGQEGVMLLDSDNHVVWFLPTDQLATNLQVQQYRGEPVLTFWQGAIVGGIGYGEVVILDANYRQVAVIRGGNGLKADLHDCTLTPEGTALVTAYTTKKADLSALGGSKHGEVFDSVVQEIDVASGKVVHEWHSMDHVPVSESQSKPGKGAFDYFHINSVSLDDPDHLLVSARNTWALYRVDRSSGEVVSRLGGKKSDFALGPGVEFYWQHHSRRQPNGTITVFDDGATPAKEGQSRGLVLRLDDAAKTIALDKAYTHPAHLLTDFEGSVQVLPDGHVFIGWGALPYFSEFDADGKLIFDGRLPTNVQSYRAFRANWTGRPLEAPAVATATDSFGNVVVYMSWNGATELASWQVLMGKGAGPMRPVGSAEKESFETTVTVQKLGTNLVAVALDAKGRELARSKTVAV
ncbi:MAG TPA: arylsulfotransferase family protein [Acidimicrobiales bacterium]